MNPLNAPINWQPNDSDRCWFQQGYVADASQIRYFVYEKYVLYKGNKYLDIICTYSIIIICYIYCTDIKLLLNDFLT